MAPHAEAGRKAVLSERGSKRVVFEPPESDGEPCAISWDSESQISKVFEYSELKRLKPIFKAASLQFA